jgi:3-oxoacyl-[acyl-carrier-protein] synthase III
MSRPLKITGLGSYLPAQLLSSELEAGLGLPPGWSIKHSGVAARHRVTFESNGYMGARALEQALDDAGLTLSGLDMIISASATFDYPIPNRASIIKNEMKDGSTCFVPAIDIDTTCLGFISALEFAGALLDGRNYHRIGIVSSEISSHGLNPSNPETATLFGDGAAAVILEYCPEGTSSVIKVRHQTYSEGVHDTIYKGGGNKYPYQTYPYDPLLHSFSMNGKNLLRLAKNRLPAFMNWFFKDTPFSLPDVDVVIPHQASRTGISLFRKMFSIDDTKLMENLSEKGNCIAASIPLLLCEAVKSGQIDRGDLCLLFGTSAGFTVGAALLIY